ncbi:MAG: autotransporter-associated beta strand repeat-containing protein [Pirellulales bacterium]
MGFFQKHGGIHPGSSRWMVRLIGALAMLVAASLEGWAVDTSAPAILQWFDSSYGTQEKRVADFFAAGYGSTWIPPTGRADSGNQSVGYDVFDRFDLGSTGNKTLYGTETGLRAFASTMHRAAGDVIVDLVWNHNGFSNAATTGFAAAGGYPGFVLSAAGTTDGDFHGAFETGDLNGRLSGLIDIKHETNLTYIRQPVAAGNPQNIPAGTFRNIPSAANARFYPDRNLGGTAVYNPRTGQNTTLYSFNTADPTAGDAVAENATGLLMRNARWLVNDVGVDGFRLDAARHFEPWLLNYFDEAVYRASRRTLLNGAAREVFSFSESASTDRANLMSQFVRKDLGTLPANQIGGNRDALDFAQFWPIKYNLSSNGTANDFRNMVYAGLDVYDDGQVNGSSGVVFVQSHDDFGPDMMNVAYAFSLMRPGNAVVYYNANEYYDPARTFPKPGRGDALGNYGNTITTLVDLRNRYGRGDYRQRVIEKENYAFERSSAALVMLSNRNDSGYDARTMSVDFGLGQRLVELTGNATKANATLGAGTIPEVVQVQGTTANRYVNARFLRNDGKDQGYLVYGLPTPRSSAGIELTGSGVGPVIVGDNPPEFQGGETTSQVAAIQVANATSRLASMRVINGPSVSVRLATQAVTLADGYRDRSADGDQALLRINEGLDLNRSGAVDVTTPGDVSYGFERFATTAVTGFSQASGNGLFEQSIDATLLPEGMNFLTVRAYRHRDPTSGGDGGPAVYSEFKQVLYVDRFKPESAFDQFKAFSGGTGNNDVWIRSVDGTADRVNVFQNVAATVPDATILGWVNAGQRATEQIDRNTFKTGFFGVPNGNNTYTVVTREITGSYNIQRFTGRRPASGRGAGFGDLNFDGTRDAGDMTGTSYGFERVLSSKNAEFSAAADVTGDGLVNTYDLLQMEGLLTGSANAAAATALAGVKFRRVNFVNDGVLDEADLGVLRGYAALASGGDTWTYDLDADGQIDSDDVAMAQQQFGMAPTAGVPAMMTWTGSDSAAGGPGTWSTAGLAWRGAVSDASLAMPLVPGSRALLTGTGVAITVSGSTPVAGGIEISTSGLAAVSGSGALVFVGTTEASREIAVANGAHAVIAVRLVGADGLTKTGSGRLTLSAFNPLAGPVFVAAGTLALGAGGSTGSVLGDISLADGTTLAVNRSNAAVLSTPLSGSGGLIQMGSGVTTLTVANTFSGPTRVQTGELRIEHPDALAATAATVVGGRLAVGDGVAARIRGLSVAGGSVDVGVGSLTIGPGGIELSELVAALETGRGSGDWSGSAGIVSSAVATDVSSGVARSVGWREQADGSILVGYAAAGDVTMDGMVDVLDAADLLAAGKFNSAASATWQQGDFNYDGLFDALDLAAMLTGGLLDQGSYVPAQHVLAQQPLAVVPEPAHFGLTAAAIACSLESLRRRSKRGAATRAATRAATWGNQ